MGSSGRIILVATVLLLLPRTVRGEVTCKFRLHQDDSEAVTFRSTDLSWSAPRHLYSWVHRAGHPCTQLHMSVDTDAEISLWNADSLALVPQDGAGIWTVQRGERYFIVVQRGRGAVVDRAALPLHAIGTGHDDSISFEPSALSQHRSSRADATVILARHALSVQLSWWLREMQDSWRSRLQLDQQNDRRQATREAPATGAPSHPQTFIEDADMADFLNDLPPVQNEWLQEVLPRLAVDPGFGEDGDNDADDNSAQQIRPPQQEDVEERLPVESPWGLNVVGHVVPAAAARHMVIRPMSHHYGKPWEVAVEISWPRSLESSSDSRPRTQ